MLARLLLQHIDESDLIGAYGLSGPCIGWIGSAPMQDEGVLSGRDNVMGCYGVWLFYVESLFFRQQPHDTSSYWASCVLAYWGSAALLPSL